MRTHSVPITFLASVSILALCAAIVGSGLARAQEDSGGDVSVDASGDNAAFSFPAGQDSSTNIAANGDASFSAPASADASFSAPGSYAVSSAPAADASMASLSAPVTDAGAFSAPGSGAFSYPASQNVSFAMSAPGDSAFSLPAADQGSAFSGPAAANAGFSYPTAADSAISFPASAGAAAAVAPAASPAPTSVSLFPAGQYAADSGVGGAAYNAGSEGGSTYANSPAPISPTAGAGYAGQFENITSQGGDLHAAATAPPPPITRAPGASGAAAGEDVTVQNAAYDETSVVPASGAVMPPAQSPAPLVASDTGFDQEAVAQQAQAQISLAPIGAGPAMMLSWQAPPGAQNVSISPGVGAVGPSGSMPVYPRSQNEDYTMTVASGDGTQAFTTETPAQIMAALPPQPQPAGDSAASVTVTAPADAFVSAQSSVNMTPPPLPSGAAIAQASDTSSAPPQPAYASPPMSGPPPPVNTPLPEVPLSSIPYTGVEQDALYAVLVAGVTLSSLVLAVYLSKHLRRRFACVRAMNRLRSSSP